MEKTTWKEIEAKLEARQYRQLINIRQSYRSAVQLHRTLGDVPED